MRLLKKIGRDECTYRNERLRPGYQKPEQQHLIKSHEWVLFEQPDKRDGIPVVCSNQYDYSVNTSDIAPKTTCQGLKIVLCNDRLFSKSCPPMSIFNHTMSVAKTATDWPFTKGRYTAALAAPTITIRIGIALNGLHVSAQQLNSKTKDETE